VAQAHLALGDTPAAAQWYEDCLIIARDSYPYIEARALAGLAATRLSTGDPTSARHTAEQAAKIAGSRGYRLLEEQALATQHAAAE
jgi:hypothetical protein